MLSYNYIYKLFYVDTNIRIFTGFCVCKFLEIFEKKYDLCCFFLFRHFFKIIIIYVYINNNIYITLFLLFINLII